METLQTWGYTIKSGTTINSSSANYFSATDQERLDDFQQMLDNDQVKAVLCARGGYGVGRIIDRIDFTAFRKKPKWIIGFSDITVLHAHIFSNYKIASVHGPMAAAFNDGQHKNEYVQSLRKVLAGKKSRYQCAPHAFNQKGEAIGELVGGNLTLLAHLIGTSSDMKLKGKILFLEDVGEYVYNIDRMLNQFKRCGKLDKLAGLIIGGFSESKDTDRPFGKTAYEIIHEMVKNHDYPVCFNFPISHNKENAAVKIGVGYKLKVSRSKVLLEE